MIRHPRFTLRAGDRHVLRFTLTDADGGGAALDLGSMGLRFAIARLDRITGRAQTPVVIKDLDAGVTAYDAPEGVYDVTLLGADTADLLGVYDWELETVEAGETVALAVGEIDFVAGIGT